MTFFWLINNMSFEDFLSFRRSLVLRDFGNSYIRWLILFRICFCAMGVLLWPMTSVPHFWSNGVVWVNQWAETFSLASLLQLPLKWVAKFWTHKISFWVTMVWSMCGNHISNLDWLQWICTYSIIRCHISAISILIICSCGIILLITIQMLFIF